MQENSKTRDETPEQTRKMSVSYSWCESLEKQWSRSVYRLKALWNECKIPTSDQMFFEERIIDQGPSETCLEKLKNMVNFQLLKCFNPNLYIRNPS